MKQKQPRVFVGIVMLAAMLCGAETHAQPVDYDALLAAAKEGNGEIDFQRLRYAFAGSAHYRPYFASADQRTAMFDAFSTADYAKAAAAAERLLADDYVDIDAHMLADLSDQRLGNKDEAGLHHRWAVGLLRSILASGDGKAPDTAFIVIAVDEEYSLMRALGLRPQSQALVREGEHTYDRMQAIAQDESRQTLFFNVDLPTAWFGKSFSPKP